MPRTDFARMRCPVARAMAVLGERWTILILREAFAGTTRFDEFERNLGIAPNILVARLSGLVEHGLLEKAAAEGGRHDYRLTEKGRDAFPLYLALKRLGRPLDGAARGAADRAGGARDRRARCARPHPRRSDGAPLGPEDVPPCPAPAPRRAPAPLRRREGPPMPHAPTRRVAAAPRPSAAGTACCCAHPGAGGADLAAGRRRRSRPLLFETLARGAAGHGGAGRLGGGAALRAADAADVGGRHGRRRGLRHRPRARRRASGRKRRRW